MIAVGGCYAEAQRERIFELYPEVDVAFGPGSIAHLGDWLGAGGIGVARGRFGLDERAFAADAADAPRARASRPGCRSRWAATRSAPTASSRRSADASRAARPGEVVAEVDALARDGVRELTLLGQNVNSYGRDLAPEVATEFGELLRACDAVDGIERIRFTSPHPKDFREPVIAAIAECDAVCEHVHLPLQSGSTRGSSRRCAAPTRASATSSSSTRLRAAIPDLALGTDIIVGFPGETEDDFAQTLELVEEVGFDSAYTFVYSPRQGTEAAAMADQVAARGQDRAAWSGSSS